MTTGFLTSKKFRYLCIAAYGLLAMLSTLVGIGFFGTLVLWAELDPSNKPYSLVLIVTALITILVINLILFAGLIWPMKSIARPVNKILGLILNMVGIVVCFSWLQFSYRASLPALTEVFIYAIFPITILIHLVRFGTLTGFYRK